MRKKKATTFNITEMLKYMEMEILRKTELPRTLFHKRAIEYFLAGDQKVEERLKITKRSDPRYVKKTVTEQIALDRTLEKKLLAVAEREECGITVVLFQALLNYCLKCANVLEQDVIDNIIFDMSGTKSI